MKFKVGDEVVLRDDIKVGNSYGDVYVSEELQSAIGGSVEILEKGSGFPKRYYVANGNSFNSISETMIDHEKTAEPQTDVAMKTFLVMSEHDKGTIQYLVTADEIAYTTQSVFLNRDNQMVAYFRREDVISIVEHPEDRYGKWGVYE